MLTLGRASGWRRKREEGGRGTGFKGGQQGCRMASVGPRHCAS